MHEAEAWDALLRTGCQDLQRRLDTELVKLQWQQLQTQAQADVVRLSMESGRWLPGFISTGPSPPPSQVCVAGTGLTNAMMPQDSMGSFRPGMSQETQGQAIAFGDGSITQLNSLPDGAPRADPLHPGHT